MTFGMAPSYREFLISGHWDDIPLGDSYSQTVTIPAEDLWWEVRLFTGLMRLLLMGCVELCGTQRKLWDTNTNQQLWGWQKVMDTALPKCLLECKRLTSCWHTVDTINLLLWISRESEVPTQLDYTTRESGQCCAQIIFAKRSHWSQIFWHLFMLISKRTTGCWSQGFTLNMFCS